MSAPSGRCDGEREPVMKYVERDSCFESNSSSQHVIISTKQDEHLTREEIQDEVHIYNGKINLLFSGVDEGYGRGPFQVLTTYEEKLSYAICEYCGDSTEREGNLDKILGVVKQDLPDITGFEFRTRYECIYLDEEGNIISDWQTDYHDGRLMYQDYNGKWHPVRETDCHIDIPQIGLIDHQSMGMLRSFLEKNKIDLREFLINKRYIIVIDGDETCTFIKMMEANLININNIEDIKGII